MHFVSVGVFGVKFACVLALILFALFSVRDRARRTDGSALNSDELMLPTSLVQSVVLVAAAAVALGLALMATTSLYSDAAFATRAILFCELALLSLWLVPARAVRRRLVHASSSGKPVSRSLEMAPRSLACLGLVGQLAIFATAAKYRCAPEAVALRDLGSRGGAAVLTLVVLGSALVYCYRIRREPRVSVAAASGLVAFIRSRASAAESTEPRQSTAWSRIALSLLVLVPAAVILGAVPFSDVLCVDPQRAGFLGLPSAMELLADRSSCPHGSELLQILNLDARVLSLVFVGAAVLLAFRALRPGVELAIFLALSLVGARGLYGTWELSGMVSWQAEHAWGVFVAPAVLVAWLVAASRARSALVAWARSRSLPFMNLLERVAAVAVSALLVVLFFGGSSIPFLSRLGVELRFGETLVTTQLMPHPLLIGLGVLACVTKLVVVMRVAGPAGAALERRAHGEKQAQFSRMLLAFVAVNAGLIALAQKFGGGGSLSKLLPLLGDLSMGLVAVAAPLVAVYLLVTQRGFERLAPRSAATPSEPAPVELSPVEARAHLS